MRALGHLIFDEKDTCLMELDASSFICVDGSAIPLKQRDTKAIGRPASMNSWSLCAVSLGMFPAQRLR